MRSALALAFWLVASPLAAQDGLRAADRLLTEAELTEYLTGQVIEFFDGSKSRYSQTGGYGYTYTDDGPVWRGEYAVGADSDVCVTFENGSARCDLIVESAGRMTLITSDGLRFPIRNRSVSQE